MIQRLRHKRLHENKNVDDEDNYQSSALTYAAKSGWKFPQ